MISENKINEIKKLYNKGMPICMIARAVHVAKSTVYSHIGTNENGYMNRKHWKYPLYIRKRLENIE